MVHSLCLNIKIYKKIIFGEIVFDSDFHKITKIHDDVKDDDDFNNGNICKIYKYINDVLYTGTTCITLKKCLSKFKKDSKIKRNWSNNECYNIIYLNNVNIELIEIFPCDHANSLKCKKNKVIDKTMNEIKRNKSK